MVSVRCASKVDDPSSRVSLAVMKRASEYKAHAQECRDLAARMEQAEHRAQLLQMAEHWAALAEEHLSSVAELVSGRASEPTKS